MQVKKTVFEIPKMDCPSEENLIKVKLSDVQGIKKLEFNLDKRELSVYYSDNLKKIEDSIHSLNLGGKIVSSEDIDFIEVEEEKSQRKILIIVLLINFAFFLIEIITGIISNSMGLVADSLDMLADTFVYGISLLTIGSTFQRKKRVATLAGIFQLSLAIIGFIEILRRFLGLDKIPDFELMIIVSFFAAIANSICLHLLQKTKSKDAHIKASMIFTSNDVIINIGVIIAGLLVVMLNSQIPDLVVGAIVFVIVISGAIRILKLGN